MKALFITGGSTGTVFPQAPLARATRDAGHDVIMAGPDSVTEVIAQSGLSPVSISAQASQRLSTDLPDDVAEQMRYVGRWYGRMAADTLGTLLEIADAWRPDVVFGGGMFYLAALLGHERGLPTVRQPWGVLDAREYDRGAAEELRPYLDSQGLDGLPAADLLLDVTPPSLRAADAPAAQPLRWIPDNLRRPLEPWMYSRGERPRILLTSGSRVTAEGTLHTMGLQKIRELAAGCLALGAETILAVPDDVARAVRGDLPELKAGWTPLDSVAPTCDLIVHHGGVGSNMTALAAGVPQVIAREVPSLGEMEPQARFGAALDLPPERQSAEEIVACCAAVLDEPSYARSARLLAEEIAALPTPAEVVAVVEKLVGS